MAVIKILNTEDKYCDDTAIEDVMKYVVRGSADFGVLNLSKNYYIEGVKGVTDFYGNNGNPFLIHFLIAFDTNCETESWMDNRIMIISNYIAQQFSDYQLLWGVHLFNKEKSLNPHVHFILNPINFKTGSILFSEADWEKKIVEKCKECLKIINIKLCKVTNFS